MFASRILRGCRTRKMSASAWTGFESPNALRSAQSASTSRSREPVSGPPRPPIRLQLATELVTEVLDICSILAFAAGTPAVDPLSLDNVKGVVLRTYGTGNAPEDP